MVTSCFLKPLNRRDGFNLRVCHPACLWTHLGFCFYSSFFHLLRNLASAKTSNFLSDSFWGVVTNSQSFGGLPQSLIWLTVHLQAPTAHTGAGSRLGLSTSHLWPEKVLGSFSPCRWEIRKKLPVPGSGLAQLRQLGPFVEETRGCKIFFSL